MGFTEKNKTLKNNSGIYGYLSSFLFLNKINSVIQMHIMFKKSAKIYQKWHVLKWLRIQVECVKKISACQQEGKTSDRLDMYLLFGAL